MVLWLSAAVHRSVVVAVREEIGGSNNIFFSQQQLSHNRTSLYTSTLALPENWWLQDAGLDSHMRWVIGV